MKRLLILVCILSFACPAYAQKQNGGHLTSQQLERVRACQQLLQQVEQRTLQRMVFDLEKTPYPEENLQILEAVALTYDKIVREQKVAEQKNKVWLYSKIELNMAYLQLGGLHARNIDDDPLNRLIRSHLKEHLSSVLLTHPSLFISLE